MASTYRIRELVNQVRSRWRRRALIQGAALTLMTLLFFAALYLLLYTQTSVSIGYLNFGLVPIALVALGAVVVLFLIRPALMRLDDRQIALYIEERIPGLEDRLNSAVEIGDAGQRMSRGSLVDKLIDDAVRQSRAIPIATVVDRKKERILAYVTAAVVVLFAVFSFSMSDEILNALSGARLAFVQDEPAPAMSVLPGNVEIEKGESQDVIVELRDATESEVELNYRSAGGEWQKEIMRRGLGQPTFLHEFLDVQQPMEYFVTHEDLRSESFRITLYEYPRVAQIDLRYAYPDYTGLPDRVEENTGDIRGLKGSTVTVTVQTTGTVETAALVLDEGDPVALQPAGDGRFQAHLPLETAAYYHVGLTDRAGKQNKFPEEYQIQPVEDAKPRIAITDPQQDVRVNAIDEVYVAVNVTDDYGVKDTRLRFSVNGAEEQSVGLMEADDARAEDVNGDHVFFLEDYGLEAGDVISYYVEAEDYFAENGVEATDMYFVEVIPFDRQFTQVNNMGGMGGGGMQSQTVISQQEIITATWKLHRQRNEGTPEAFEEALEGLVRAQANLKDNIQERISSTAFSLELRMDASSQQIVEHLRNAVKEMEGALVELQGDRLQEALTPERRALNHLLKADAMNKERQVAMNQSQGGGGGGGAMEDRMSELMDLELDVSRDKYEMQQQQPSGSQGENAMDDALQRIKDLARRQQRLANQNPQELQGEEKKRYIERLKRDQDELRRQAENLANAMQQQQQQQSQSGQSSQQAQEGLQRAIDHMREAERALRNEDEQRAAASQQQALNELDRLQQDLRLAGAEGTREMLRDLQQEFENLRQQEEQLGEDIRSAYNESRRNNDSVDLDELQRLQENRRNTIANMDRLRRQAEAAEEAARSEAREEDQEVASALRNMLRGMDRDELERKMEDSERALDRGWLDLADRLEGEIASAMDGMEAQMDELEGGLPQTDEEQLRRALADLRDVMDRMEELQGDVEGASPTGQPLQNAQSQDAQSQDAQSQNQDANRGQGGGAPSPDSDRQARADAARMERQFEQAEETLQRLEEAFGNDPEARGALQRARNSLRRPGDASNFRVVLEGDAAREFFNERVFNPLSELELFIARRLDDIEMGKKIYGARKADVPAEYREFVNKYYESLAKSRQEGGR